MKPDDFIKEYENALSAQSWDAVDSLIHEDASVTFSDGSVHKGKAQVKEAFERNFSSITDEKYSISNIHWVFKSSKTAVFLFSFNWAGTVNGQHEKGSGSGTAVLVHRDGRWMLLTEHLGKRAR